MVIPQCPFCKAILQDLGPTVECRECGRSPARASSDVRLPDYPSCSMAPGKRKSREDDDDEDDDDDDDDAPRSRKKKSSGSDGTGAAVAGAAAGAAGVGIGMVILIVGGVAACCLCMIALPAIGIPMALSRLAESAARQQAINNMKQIAFAAHQYHDVNKALPSPRMRGNPAPDLSWRVSTLPFMEQDFLFKRFDTTQGWNQGKNNALLNSMPTQYRGTGDPLGSTTTKYQYFVGPNTLFPDPLTKISLGQIKDGTSNTFLFGEAANAMTWSKAEDMNIGPQGALPVPNGRFLVAMCDATVKIVNRDRVSDDGLRELINPNDGKFGPPGWDN